MADDPITGKKFVTGVVSPKTGVKVLAFIPWLLVFGALGWAIWVAYIKPHTKFAEKTQSQTFIVKPGANVTVQQKQETAKKKWYVPQPFVETFYGVQTNDTKYFGVKFGCRWEF